MDSRIAAHSSVQTVGMPPEGHGELSVQQAAVTAWAFAINCWSVAQLGADAAELGIAGAPE